MTYLDLPRLHVLGRFFADPSSMNNDPVAYEPETTRPAPWQMPKGMHYFKFAEGSVIKAIDADGSAASDPGLVGAEFRSTDQPVPGKMVDVDVYQQAVTQLFGVKVRIALLDANGNPDPERGLVGSMRTPVLNGCYFQAVLPTRGWKELYGSAGSYGADSSALGVFQTVLEVKESDWNAERRGAIETLRQRCDTIEVADGKGGTETAYLLAFKFVMDGYRNIEGESDYQYGRYTGTLGPLHDRDPIETLGARWLEARPAPKDIEWFVPQFYRAPFRVDEKRRVLQIDWAGSLSRDSFGGKPVSLGDDGVRVVVNAPTGPVELGTIVIDERTYDTGAGISELPLTDAQIQLLANAPLELWATRDDIGDPRVFAEAADGISICTQNRSLRMTSEEERATSMATATAVIRKFGKPLVGVTPNVAIIPVEGDTPGATVPPGNPGDTASAIDALGVSACESDDEGITTLTFKALKDPGSRTEELDGQMYFVYVYFGDDVPKDPPLQEAQISVLVWSSYDVIERPGWSDIEKIMRPYSKLYRGMREKFDVADEAAFKMYANNPPAAFFLGPEGKFDIPGHPEIQDGTIPFLLSLPMEDPRRMPVTRDLSPPKIETIMNYISIEQAEIRAAGKEVSSGVSWRKTRPHPNGAQQEGGQDR